jgi:hypothetical protein
MAVPRAGARWLTGWLAVVPMLGMLLIAVPSSPVRSATQSDTVIDFNANSPQVLVNGGILLTEGELRIEPVAGSNLVMPLGLDRVGFFLGPGASSNPLATHCSTLVFTAPGGLSALSLTRAGVRNFSSTPAWRLRALDAEGSPLGTMGEGPIPNTSGYYAFPTEPTEFTIAARGIASAEFCSHNTLSTFTAVPIARMTLTASPPPVIELPTPTPEIPVVSTLCEQPAPGGCPLAPGPPVAAALADPSVAHLWRLSLPRAGIVQVRLYELPAPYRLYVYAPDNSLAGVVQNEGLADLRLEFTVPVAGEYQVVVDSPLGESSPQPYRLEVRYVT